MKEGYSSTTNFENTISPVSGLQNCGESVLEHFVEVDLEGAGGLSSGLLGFIFNAC